MPIYEYQCNDCGEEFEYLILGSDAPEGCPACKGEQIRRLLSAFSHVSKGSGGETVGSSAGSSCAGCASTNCSSCGH